MTQLLKPARLIGRVTHYYGRPHVAIVKFAEDVPLETHVRFVGSTTDFEENIDSMEYDHYPVYCAQKGQEVGVRVVERAREGDRVYADD